MFLPRLSYLRLTIIEELPTTRPMSLIRGMYWCLSGLKIKIGQTVPEIEMSVLLLPLNLLTSVS